MRKSANKKKNKKVDELLFEWIKKILPEEEQDKVNKNNLQALLPKEEYLQVQKTFYLSMYTKRWTKQSIKKLLKMGHSLNSITIGDLEWLTKTKLKTDRLSIL